MYRIGKNGRIIRNWCTPDLFVSRIFVMSENFIIWKMKNVKTIKLKNGIEMPVLGFGVCQVAYFIATRAETEPEKIERTFDCLRGTACLENSCGKG